jgi:hypothetical protein
VQAVDFTHGQSFGEAQVETLAYELLGFGDGVAEIEGGYSVEDEFEGIGFVLASSTGEAMQTFRAAVDLQRLEAISAFAFLCGALAPALWADGIRMEDSGG